MATLRGAATSRSICSEFGVWGLPHPREILERDGSEPWWFESGHDWNSRRRLSARDRDALSRRATRADFRRSRRLRRTRAQELQYRALKYQIETLRWERAISGYVITELNDVQWESNGLMDVRNRPRAFAERLANLQRPWLVIARAPRTAVRVGESLDVSVRLAGAGGDGGRREAHLALRRMRRRGAALGAEPTTIALTAAEGRGRLRSSPLELEARDGEGRLLSRNALEFCVVPPLAGAAPPLFPIDAAAEAMLAAIGWPNRAAVAADAAVVVATRLTTPVREMLLAGRKVLLIANSVDALVDPKRELPLADRHNFPSMLLRAREGTPWDGQWMGAFSWRRDRRPLGELAERPDARRTLDRPDAEPCFDRLSFDRLRRTGRFRHGGRMAASRRGVRQA